MHILLLWGSGSGKRSYKEVLQYLVAKVVHHLADPLAAGRLVAGEARAALAVGDAREDALGQGERVGLVGPEIPQNILCVIELNMAAIFYNQCISVYKVLPVIRNIFCRL